MSFRSLVASLLCIATSTAALAQGPAPVEAAENAAPVYTLGTGDKVRVTVYGEQSVNGDYAVGPDGDIAFPLIGNIAAIGHTVAQLREAITRKLASGYLLDPRVTVEVLTFRPFYILGEVSRPGEYPYVNALSVEQAVAKAGGYTYRANKKKVFLRRGSGAEVEVQITREKPVWINPGDTIRIGERYF